MDQTADILSVSPISKSHQQKRHHIHFIKYQLTAGIHPCLSKEHKKDHKAEISGQRAQGYIVGSEKQKKEHHCAYQKDPPVKSQKKPNRRGNSLASLKFQIKRKIMSKDTSGSGIKFQQTYIVSLSSMASVCSWSFTVVMYWK